MPSSLDFDDLAQPPNQDFYVQTARVLKLPNHYCLWTAYCVTHDPHPPHNENENEGHGHGEERRGESHQTRDIQSRVVKAERR